MGGGSDVKPILYAANATNFFNLGLGVLNDAYSCLVHEKRNGAFYLEMEYPVEGALFKELQNNRLIKADAGHELTDQRFKIKKITKPIDGKVKVYAEHISYKAAELALKPHVNIRNATAQQALQQWQNNFIDDDKPFTLSSNITTVNSTSWSIREVENPRQALGGVQGSILDVWGGEYKFDNYHISLFRERGVRANALIAYGRNITDFEQEEDITSVYTSVYPYAVYTDEDGVEHLVTIPEYIVDSEHVDKYPNRMVLPIDFTAEFGSEETPTVQRLRSMAQSYIESNEIGIPKVSIRLTHVDLSKTLDYKQYKGLEKVNLCDNVLVKFLKLGVDTTAKVIGIIWNVLLERYEELEIGESRSSLSSRLNAIDQEARQARKEAIDARNFSSVAANGINMVFFGPDEPTATKVGDRWFEENGEYTISRVWDGVIWRVIHDPRITDSNKRAIEAHQQDIQSAQSSADTANQQINDAITSAGFTGGDLTDVMQNLEALSDTARQIGLGAQQTADDLEGTLNSEINRVSGLINGVSERSDEIANDLIGIGNEVTTVSQRADNAFTLIEGLDEDFQSMEFRIDRINNDLSLKLEQGDMTSYVASEISLSESRFQIQLENALAGIDVNDRNFIIDSALEDSYKSDFWSLAGSAREISFVSDGTTHRARLTRTGEGSSRSFFTSTPRALSDIGVSVGDELTFSFNQFQHEGLDSGSATAFVQCRGASGVIADIAVHTFSNRTGGINRVVNTATIPVGTERVAVSFAIGAVGGIIRFNRVKLQAGNVATVWSPAPEDFTSSIDSLRTYTEQQIQSTAQQFTQQLTTLQTYVDDTEDSLVRYTDNQISQTSQAFNQQLTSISGNLSDLGSDLDTVGNDLTVLRNTTEQTAEETRDEISRLEVDISNRATSTQFNELTTTVNGTVQTISDIETDLDSKASNSRVNTIEDTVDGTLQTIATLRTDVDGKASNSRVNTIEQTVEGTQQTILDVQNDLTSLENQASKNLIREDSSGYVSPDGLSYVWGTQLNNTNGNGVVVTATQNGGWMWLSSVGVMRQGMIYTLHLTMNKGSGSGIVDIGQGDGNWIENFLVSQNTTRITHTFEAPSSGRLSLRFRSADSYRIAIASLINTGGATTQRINQIESTVEGTKQTIATLRTDVDGKATVQQFNEIDNKVDGSIQRIGDAEGKLTTIESNVNGLQTTVSGSDGLVSQVSQVADGFNVLSRQSSQNLILEDEDGYASRHTYQNSWQTSFNHDNGDGFVINGNTNGAWFWITHDSYGGLQQGKIYTLHLVVNNGTGNRNITLTQGDGYNLETYTVSQSGTTINHTFEAVRDGRFGIRLSGTGPFRITRASLIETGGASQAQLSVINDAINLRVSKGDIMSQINIEAGRTLIDTDRLYLSANTTVFGGSAFIPNAAIESLSADKLTAGTIDAAQVNVINLDVNNITGNRTEFVQSVWNGLGTTRIDSDGIQVLRANGGTYIGYDPDRWIGVTDRYEVGLMRKAVRMNSGVFVSENEVNRERLILDSGQLIFINPGDGTTQRIIKTNSEGIEITPSDFNMGTDANTSIRLTGKSGATGAHQYIDFNENPTSPNTRRARIEHVYDELRLRHPNDGWMRVRDRNNTTDSGLASAFVWATHHSSGETIQLVRNRLQTPRTGNRDLFISPQGTGVVQIATSDLSYYNIRVSNFLTSSARRLKTDIEKYTESALNHLNRLNIVEYRLKKDIEDGVDLMHVGLIAEEAGYVSDGQSIDTYKLLSLNTKAIQELDDKQENVLKVSSHAYLLAEQHEDELECLRKEVKELKEEIEELRGMCA